MISGSSTETVVNQNQRALEKIDIFGVSINIKYNQESKHKTQFGGIITLAILSCLVWLLFSIVQSMVQKNNPAVIFEQFSVSNPTRYNFTENNFSFVVTLMDGNGSPIYDESVFRLKGNFVYKEPSVNPDGTLGPSVYLNKEIELENCNQNHFQVQNTQDYFLGLNYKQMYCIKHIEDFYLIGQYEMSEFSVIQFFVILCDENDPENKVQCMETTQREKLLSISYLQVFYSTQIIDVRNKVNPFKSIGQTVFWNINLDYLQSISLLFMKTYVNDDIGLFSTNIETADTLLFSSERTVMSTKQNFSIFEISVYLEKNKEQAYNRNYMKVPEAVSQLGGIYNVLFILGFMIAQPYSQMQLNRKLFNSTFSYDNQTDSEKSNDKHQPPNSTKSPRNKKKKQNQKKQQQQSQKIEEQSAQQPNKNPRTISESSANESPSQDYNENNNPKEKKEYLRVSNTVKNKFCCFFIEIKEYFSYLSSCFKIGRTNETVIMDYGTQQISTFTDICFIINKLLELEKLKNLLLNEEQVKLFDFIPKPQINYQIIQDICSKEQKRRSIKGKRSLSMKENVADSSAPERKYNQSSIENKNLSSEQNKQFNILLTHNKTNYEKSKEAQDAFNNIYKNQVKRSKIDIKLIQMLDENLINLFHQNTFDEKNLVAGSGDLFNQQNYQNSMSFQNNEGQQPFQFAKIDRYSQQNSSPGGKYSNNKLFYLMKNKIDEKSNQNEMDTSDVFELSEINGRTMQWYPDQTKSFMQQTEMRNRNFETLFSTNENLKTTLPKNTITIPPTTQDKNTSEIFKNTLK